MAKIKIKRTNEWNNWTRQIGVYMDNQKIGTILNGETKEFDVPSGQHTVRAKIDWCGSKNLTIQTNENEIKTVTISSFKFGRYLMPGFAGLVVLYFILKKFGDSKFTDIILVITLPILLLVTYYWTVGRSSYLQIKEIQTEIK
jgi:hypothetical protein